MKDEALRIFLSVLDPGGTAVSLVAQLCFVSLAKPAVQSALASVIWANCCPGRFEFRT